MRVLQINNFHYLRGGSERVYFDTARLLRENGHEVRYFSVHHPENLAESEDHLWGPEFDPAASRGLWNQSRAAARILRSRPNERQLEKMLDEFPIDVAHAHNIYGRVCPSVFRVLRRREIPIVLTLHDYKLCCPVYTFFQNGHPCTKCLEDGPFAVVRNRCSKNSLAASMVLWAENRVHAWRGYYNELVDAFICPSQWLLERHVEAGISKEKLFHLPYPIDLQTLKPRTKHGGYLLFAGRLSAEKGLEVLLDAVENLPTQLQIAGEGPLRPALEARVRERGQRNVTFRGRLTGQELEDAFQRAAWNIVPSIWFENQPLTILESFAYGVPVLASDLGAIPELVQEGETGALFTPGDSESLRNRLEELLPREDQRNQLSGNARRLVEENFSSKIHLDRLLALYERILGQ